MGDDFLLGGGSSGAALQNTWFGGAPVGHRPAASSRRHMTIESCMAEVRRVLYAAGRPLKLRELTQETGRDGMAIGSVLTKLQVSKLVDKVPPPDGKTNGASTCGSVMSSPKRGIWRGEHTSRQADSGSCSRLVGAYFLVMKYTKVASSPFVKITTPGAPLTESTA